MRSCPELVALTRDCGLSSFSHKASLLRAKSMFTLLASASRIPGSTQNVYMQLLAGGAETQLTHFDSEPAVMQAFAWSRDGKKLAITRARYNDTDVVLFTVSARRSNQAETETQNRRRSPATPE